MAVGTCRARADVRRLGESSAAQRVAQAQDHLPACCRPDFGAARARTGAAPVRATVVLHPIQGTASPQRDWALLTSALVGLAVCRVCRRYAEAFFLGMEVKEGPAIALAANGAKPAIRSR